MDTKLNLSNLSPVLPAVILSDVDAAVPVARALAEGGIRSIEITLRTDVAIEAIRHVAAEVPDIIVGAGTVTTPEQAKQVAAAGAQFLVSPGATPRLTDAALETGLMFLPGATTASEAMLLAEQGITEFKFFPAKASGGIDFIRAIAGPLPDIHWCPTGGIGEHNAAEYLVLPTVHCVGGSWLTPQDAITAKNFGRIKELASRAAKLVG